MKAFFFGLGVGLFKNKEMKTIFLGCFSIVNCEIAGYLYLYCLYKDFRNEVQVHGVQASLGS